MDDGSGVSTRTRRKDPHLVDFRELHPLLLAAVPPDGTDVEHAVPELYEGPPAGESIKGLDQSLICVCYPSPDSGTQHVVALLKVVRWRAGGGGRGFGRRLTFSWAV